MCTWFYRYCWTQPIRNKTKPELTKQFEKLFKRSGSFSIVSTVIHRFLCLYHLFWKKLHMFENTVEPCDSVWQNSSKPYNSIHFSIHNFEFLLKMQDPTIADNFWVIKVCTITRIYCNTIYYRLFAKVWIQLLLTKLDE